MHTPGPWSRNIKPARKYGVVFAGRNTHVAEICSVGMSDVEVEANCDLITAAPDLLESLKTLREDWIKTEDHGACDCPLCKADTAIAKAEGR